MTRLPEDRIERIRINCSIPAYTGYGKSNLDAKKFAKELLDAQLAYEQEQAVTDLKPVLDESKLSDVKQAIANLESRQLPGIFSYRKAYFSGITDQLIADRAACPHIYPPIADLEKELETVLDNSFERLLHYPMNLPRIKEDSIAELKSLIQRKQEK